MTDLYSSLISSTSPMRHRFKFDSFEYIRNRELGKKPIFGTKDAFYSCLYSKFEKVYQTLPPPFEGKDWGSIFGFGFNPNGTVVATACEKKCFLLYDPMNQQLITRKFDAHTDCVNCVKFLDSRLFVTCSDDESLRLWDLRYLKNSVRTLDNAHTNWVKNIEYIPSQATLLTSGFDGNVFSWDINNAQSSPEKVLTIKGMLRTVLTPSADKMIISTLGGYFIIIHNFSLDHLQADMNGFKPHLFRLMKALRVNSEDYNHMFERERNKVEFMGDFPQATDSISSLEVHPYGWCVASRSSTVEDVEWTCIHDIQSKAKEEKKRVQDNPSNNPSSSGSRLEQDRNPQDSYIEEQIDQSIQRLRSAPEEGPFSISQLRSVFRLFNEYENDSSDSNEELEDDDSEAEDGNEDLHLPSDDDEYLAQPIPSILDGILRGDVSSDEERYYEAEQRILTEEISPDQLNEKFEKYSENVYVMTPRLLFHSEEPNVGSGFIKVQSFSPDGRVLASPFGKCVRLLAYDSSCLELCDCVPVSARPLEEICTLGSMNSIVLTSTFSPTQPILVAGGQNGSVSFCTPHL